MKGPIEYIKEAWSIYTKKENFIFFARIMAVLTITSVSISYLSSYISQFVLDPQTSSLKFDNPPLVAIFIVVSILSAVFFFYQSSTTYMAILNMNSEEKKVFKLGLKNMGILFLIMLVIWLIILLGLVLLIIPAIIFGTWYSFSIYLVLDKKMKIGAALKESKAMVKGKFWKVLGRNIVFGILSMLIGFAFAVVPYVGGTISLFIAPFFMLPSYLLYRDLSTNG